MFMEAAADMHARHAATLAELSALGLELARKVQASAMAAETPKDEAVLTNAFHKLSRSVRQTMALEAKLTREADRARPTPPAPPRPQTRYDRIHSAVSRLIWDEYEDDEDEAQDLEDQLDDILEQDLPDIPEEDIVAQIAEHLGLNSSPLGEGDAKRTEGVEAHEPRQPELSTVDVPAPQPPQSAFTDSSPRGEQLGWPDPLPYPLPPLIISTTGYPCGNLRRRPLGPPGEFPPWEEVEWQDSA